MPDPELPRPPAPFRRDQPPDPALRSERRALARLVGQSRLRVDDLERSNRDLQGFASAAAHDLTHPLGTVTASLERLRGPSSGHPGGEPETLRLLDLAIESSRRMRALVERLLDQARAASIGEPEWVDGTALAREVIDDLGADLDRSDATVALAPLPRMLADRVGLRRVLCNLVCNTLAFADPDAPVAVRISAVTHERWWELRVEETGTGAEPRDSGPGSSRGLAMCESIVARHRGRLWIEPRPGGGSRFCFTIARDPVVVGGA